MTRPIYNILLPLPFDTPFSYFAPDDLMLEIGDVVKVPFRSKEIFGVVISETCSPYLWGASLHQRTMVAYNLDEKKIKIIITKKSDLKLSTKLLEFIDFVATYNLVPKGLVLKLAISILNSAKENKKKKLFPEKSQSININLKPLLPEQQEATDILFTKINEGKFSTILLDGITGSGKTEIYFQAIAEVLKKHNDNSKLSCHGANTPHNDDVINIKRQLSTSSLQTTSGSVAIQDIKIENQILILLPEIALTSQLCNRFTEQFGFKPDLWHSKISNSKKLKIFEKVADGSCRVLIGARSALFLPFKNLKLIVVDEEHDASFKQEDIVNYNGRDMAIMRAKLEDFPIILSTATPSLESYLNAKNGKYQLISLVQRFSPQDKTEVILQDMRKEKLVKDQFISSILKNELEENLKNNKQSLLFLNRRGYAPLTLCKKCGHKINCSSCSSYITFHQKINRFICHHCGLTKKLINICPICNSENCLINCGAGVEKLQEEVLKYFPSARIGMMTSDVIKNINQAENLITQILEHKIDIIIGTQMIAKGHHFPALALVGIIDGDGSFFNGELRSLERSYQLLTQVIGRAGRDHYRGKVVLQTYNPENLIFKKIIEGKRDEFLEEEIKARKALNFPPFGKMAEIIFSGIDENLVIDFAKFVLKKFPINHAIQVFGPAPLPITRVKNRYHYRLNIKVEKKINLQKLIVDCLNQVKTPSSIRVKIDIDPI